jgi:hypothetical protein
MALSLDINGKSYALDDLNKSRTAAGEVEVTFQTDGVFRVAEAVRSKAIAGGY